LRKAESSTLKEERRRQEKCFIPNVEVGEER
jgi:hypothetical protein